MHVNGPSVIAAIPALSLGIDSQKSWNFSQSWRNVEDERLLEGREDEAASLITIL